MEAKIKFLIPILLIFVGANLIAGGFPIPTNPPPAWIYTFCNLTSKSITGNVGWEDMLGNKHSIPFTVNAGAHTGVNLGSSCATSINWTTSSATYSYNPTNPGQACKSAVIGLDEGVMYWNNKGHNNCKNLKTNSTKKTSSTTPAVTTTK